MMRCVDRASEHFMQRCVLYVSDELAILRTALSTLRGLSTGYNFSTIIFVVHILQGRISPSFRCSLYSSYHRSRRSLPVSLLCRYQTSSLAYSSRPVISSSPCWIAHATSRALRTESLKPTAPCHHGPATLNRPWYSDMRDLWITAISSQYPTGY